MSHLGRILQSQCKVTFCTTPVAYNNNDTYTQKGPGRGVRYPEEKIKPFVLRASFLKDMQLSPKQRAHVLYPSKKMDMCEHASRLKSHHSFSFPSTKSGSSEGSLLADPEPPARCP